MNHEKARASLAEIAIEKLGQVEGEFEQANIDGDLSDPEARQRLVNLAYTTLRTLADYIECIALVSRQGARA